MIWRWSSHRVWINLLDLFLNNQFHIYVHQRQWFDSIWINVDNIHIDLFLRERENDFQEKQEEEILTCLCDCFQKRWKIIDWFSGRDNRSLHKTRRIDSIERRISTWVCVKNACFNLSLTFRLISIDRMKMHYAGTCGIQMSW